VWSDGSGKFWSGGNATVVYNDWDAFEPDNDNGSGGPENCLGFKRSSYFWNAVDCSEKRPFMCDISTFFDHMHILRCSNPRLAIVVPVRIWRFNDTVCNKCALVATRWFVHGRSHYVMFQVLRALYLSAFFFTQHRPIQVLFFCFSSSPSRSKTNIQLCSTVPPVRVRFLTVACLENPRSSAFTCLRTAVHGVAHWEYVSSAATANAAASECATRGGHLPSIHTAEQNKRLVDFVKEKAPTATHVFLGADDKSSEVLSSQAYCCSTCTVLPSAVRTGLACSFGVKLLGVSFC